MENNEDVRVVNDSVLVYITSWKWSKDFIIRFRGIYEDVDPLCLINKFVRFMFNTCYRGIPDPSTLKIVQEETTKFNHGTVIVVLSDHSANNEDTIFFLEETKRHPYPSW